MKRRPEMCSSLYHRITELFRDSLAYRRGLSLSRKLQDGCALAGPKMREQHDLSIREFKRIVVGTRILDVDLPKTSNL